MDMGTKRGNVGSVFPRKEKEITGGGVGDGRRNRLARQLGQLCAKQHLKPSRHHLPHLQKEKARLKKEGAVTPALISW